MIARLKASLEEGKKKEKAVVEEKKVSEKADNIESLRVTFEKDQERNPVGEREQWDGSGAQMLSWHYEMSLGRYFNVPELIKPMVAKMTLAADIVFWLMIAAMIFLVVATRKTNSLSLIHI